MKSTPVFTLDVLVSDNGSPILSDTDPAQVTINLTNVNEAPIVGDGESYQTIGNTLLEVAGTKAAADPFVFVSGNLLLNDSDPEGDPIHTVLASATTGAVVTIATDGKFTYLPPAGVTSDSFTYRVVDKAGLFTTGTVSITLLGRVWYVKNNQTPGGLGRSTDPFDTLSEARTASSAGDTIYVFYGSGNTTGQDAGIMLKNNQRLIGAGVALTVPVQVNGGPNPTPLLAAGLMPLIKNAAGSGVSIVSGSAEVSGLNIAATGSAIDATYSTGGGTLTIQKNNISAAGAKGINVSPISIGSVTVKVTDNSITSTGNGFEMAVSGTAAAQLDFSRNIVSSVGKGVWVDRTGGALTVTGFAR